MLFHSPALNVGVVKVRHVTPEILDELAADDPEAIRSRADLRLVNFLMGNERWIAKQSLAFPEIAKAGGIAEIGAGEGWLTDRLQLAHPDVLVEAYDLAPRPIGLNWRVRWRQENVLETEPQTDGLLAANLFLHHFEGAALEKLADLCRSFRVLCFAEPLRSRLALAQGALLYPLVNRVTRHDMPVSIRAGFRPGELPALLRLDEKWTVKEQTTWRGGIRMIASRA